MVLKLLKDAFEFANIPNSFYKAKKTITKLGLNYEKIPVCPNNCMLYWSNKEDEERETCKICNTSKSKSKAKVGAVGVSGDGNDRKKVPAKVLCYFPLKPRLQILFLSSKSAEDMRWHAIDSKNDGMLWHPRDSGAWKHFDLTHTWFASDPRNVRLALASDGFNSFGMMSTNYSIWPVILIPYNTPPWVCMKHTHIIMSMIIPGKNMSGNDIDVYLQSLVKDLKELCVTPRFSKRVDTYDSFKKEMFTLHATLIWTVSDFPRLSTLSGWNTYTGLACPMCNIESTPRVLPHSRKWCFMSHRCFLDQRHRFRLNNVRFDGQQDMCGPPKMLHGLQILEQVQNIGVIFGRKPNKERSGKRIHGGRPTQGVNQQWKKKSIFFELPYWKENLMRHNLDMMHIEKNVKDLKAMGIRPDLWPNENGRISPAVFTLTTKGKKRFLTTLKNITVPDGYSSNISRCIDMENLMFNGMLKSHDCHILMEQLLPLAIQTTLPDDVSAIMIEFCSFFRQLCSKVLNVDDLEKLQNQVVLTLCHMEMIFPPSFFTVMVHLVVHLVEEVKLGGPVHY
ncbi:uncharacterized protein [Cicer arietinum]|uniref:Uncharacterized protein LOC101515751 n=1 Tax=Cicer arietinum TaxID=3827 RepID=A0A1S2Z510_CICAR|nr:uncharacterized protein LOC101515751 [Cicer arietinum]